jgi:hypothetical protein
VSARQLSLVRPPRAVAGRCLSVVSVLAAARFFIPEPMTAEIRVVDIIPPSLSGETGQDSEPNIAVDPTNVDNIAASAFTWEPLGGNKAPIFTSVDGGNTWSCRPCLPINQITSDVTLRFGASGQLYVTALGCPTDDCEDQLFIGRTENFAKTGLMDQMNGPYRYKVDQPYIATASFDQQDRVFIGENDWTAPNGQTSSTDRSLDAAGASSNGYTTLRLEDRNTCGRDDPEVRHAASADGVVVYVAFNNLTKIDPPKDGPQIRTGDVVIRRDDEGGNSNPPFSALPDPQDNQPGLRVVKGRRFKFNHMLGQDRLGGDLAIAVDPTNARRVYLVWSNLDGALRPVLHLCRSDDGGATWARDLRVITSAKNPGLAVNKQGTLGFLYQQVVSNGPSPPKADRKHAAKTKSGSKRSGSEETWRTIFERTNDSFAMSPDSRTLAMFPVNEFHPGGSQPFLGDYLHVMAVGNDFYGIFSSSNVPDASRFCCGVTFQRYVDCDKHILLDENKNPVDRSIDPFFFKVTGDEPMAGAAGHK